MNLVKNVRKNCYYIFFKLNHKFYKCLSSFYFFLMFLNANYSCYKLLISGYFSKIIEDRTEASIFILYFSSLPPNSLKLFLFLNNFCITGFSSFYVF